MVRMSTGIDTRARFRSIFGETAKSRLKTRSRLPATSSTRRRRLPAVPGWCPALAARAQTSGHRWSPPSSPIPSLSRLFQASHTHTGIDSRGP